MIIFLKKFFGKMDEYGRCLACEFRRNNLKDNLWIHSTRGGNTMFTNKINLNDNTRVNLRSMTSIDSYFKLGNGNLQTFFKPYNSLWFSRGTWLYDRYHERPYDHEKHEIDCDHAFIIKDPVNILYIRNKEDMVSFVDKYLDVSKEDREKLDKIEGPTSVSFIQNMFIKWDDVRKDGYYGCAFEFCKVNDIGIENEFDYKYTWYSMYDVESLCVWDSRAFDTMYPVSISTYG